MAVEKRLSNLVSLIDSIDIPYFDTEKDIKLIDYKAKCIKMGNELVDKNVSIAQQTRNCFELKQISKIGEHESLYAVVALNQGFKSNSALLKHEIAYVLGQIRDTRAISYLIDILSDMNQEPIVRHEAGEALAAIGDVTIIDVLSKFLNDPSKEVAQTCQLAIDGLKWTMKNQQLGIIDIFVCARILKIVDCGCLVYNANCNKCDC